MLYRMMMAGNATPSGITLVGTAATTGPFTSSPQTIAIPSGTQDGDWLVVILANSSAGTLTFSDTTATATKVAEVIQVASGATNPRLALVAFRRATTDPVISVSSGAFNRAFAVCLGVRGASTSASAFEATGFNSSGDGSTKNPAPGSATSLGAGRLAVAVQYLRDSTPIYPSAVPAGWDRLFEREDVVSSGMTLVVDSKLVGSGSVTGPDSFASSTTSAYVNGIAIIPPA